MVHHTKAVIEDRTFLRMTNRRDAMSRSGCGRLIEEGGSSAALMRLTISADQRYDKASSVSVAAAPTSCTSHPARAGPAKFARDWLNYRRAFPLSSRSAGIKRGRVA